MNGSRSRSRKAQQMAGARATATADELIDAHECAAMGRVSRSTWRRLGARGVAPPPVPLPLQAHRWRRSEVLRFWGLAAPEGSGS